MLLNIVLQTVNQALRVGPPLSHFPNHAAPFGMSVRSDDFSKISNGQKLSTTGTLREQATFPVRAHDNTTLSNVPKMATALVRPALVLP
jgi:hypothetical protein